MYSTFQSGTKKFNAVTAQRGSNKYPFATIKKGESFFVPCEQTKLNSRRGSVIQSLNRFNNNNGKNVEVSIERVTDTTGNTGLLVSCVR